MKNIIATMAFLAASLAIKAHAEDIDLFAGVPPQDDGNPNVLIILDNTANWNTAFENEKDALVDIFEDMDPNTVAVNVGLMLFGESPNLGYIRAAIRDMAGEWTGPDPSDPSSTVTLNYNQLYANMINDFDVGDDRGNARTLARTFAEAYRYLQGDVTVDDSRTSGWAKNDFRDYCGNTEGLPSTDTIHSLPGNAFVVDPDACDVAADVVASEAEDNYNEPPESGVCANTYVIYIGNTVPSGNVTTDNTARNRAALTDLVSAGGDTSTITEGFEYTSHQDNYADEWARFMHDELGYIFYAIDVDPTDHPEYNEDGDEGHSRGMGNSELIRSLSAGVGGGEYIRVDSSSSENIKVALGGILSEIQAENSVFASVALPASSASQSLFLNQVFIGLFRPDGNAYPKWPGNLKQYRLGRDASGNIELVDAKTDPDPVINPGTGFIRECARSYWTPETDTAPGYWFFDKQGICYPATPSNPSGLETPDGPYVEKGAQAYMLRQGDYTTRVVKTCDDDIGNCNSTGMVDFTVGNTDETVFDANDPADHAILVNWAKGMDPNDVNEDGDTTDTRAYIHGDVIHSRPIALNYGTAGDPEIVVYYGANDGMLRAVSGNQSGDIAAGTYAPGEELWAFMPPEFWGDIKRLRVNTEQVKIPATGPGSVGRPGSLKEYGMDGPITAYDYGSTKHIFAAMRRGGRSLYAFNVSDPNDPPDLMWKGGCDASGCDATTGAAGLSWSDVGQTWSPANVTNAAGHGNPILIMGGGYDACEDTDGGTSGINHSCTVASETGNDTVNLDSITAQTGDHIYVIDAVNGDLLAVFDTERSVPGGVTIVPSVVPTEVNPYPNIAYAYAADTGGNVYRIQGPDDEADPTDPIPTAIGGAVPGDWKMTLIASVGCGTQADDDCESPDIPNRKFLHGVDVVQDLANSSQFRILGGSGDREKPLVSYSSTTEVDNYFYSFADYPLVSDWLDLTSDCGADVICMDVLQDVTHGTADGVTADGVTPIDGIASLDADAKGFAFALSDEEQVVTGALVVGDIANFSTHIPYDPNEADDADICINKLGTATTYNIDFEDASGQMTDILTGGLVPTPVAGIVEICEDGVCEEEPFCFSCGDDRSPIGGGSASTGSSFEQSKGRVFWKVEP